MIHPPHVVILPPVGWDELPQRPQRFAAGLAASGLPVIYVEPWSDAPAGVRTIATRVTVLRPAGRSNAAKSICGYDISETDAASISAAILRIVPQTSAVCLVQHPGWVDVVEMLALPTIYDVMDDWPRMPHATSSCPEAHSRLLQQSHKVTASSMSLGSRARGSVSLIPNACETVLSRARLIELIRARQVTFDNYGAGRALFVGTVGDWVDVDALLSLAQRSPTSIDLIGPLVHTRSLELVASRHLDCMGKVAPSNTLRYLARAQIGLIPFVSPTNGPSGTVDPVKAYEYLLWGLPVVSTPLPGASPSLRENICQFPNTHWGLQVVNELSRRPDFDASMHRHEWARSQTWNSRVDALLSILTEVA